MQHHANQGEQTQHMPPDVALNPPQPQPAGQATPANAFPGRVEAEGSASGNAQLPVPTPAKSAVESYGIALDRNSIALDFDFGAAGGCCAALCALALAFARHGTLVSLLQLLLEFTAVVVGWWCLLWTGANSNPKQQCRQGNR